MFKRGGFLAGEFVILVVATIVVFSATALIGIFGTNYVIQDIPIFGNVVFEDFHSCLIFCTKVALIAIYVIRPILWVAFGGLSGPPKRDNSHRSDD